MDPKFHSNLLSSTAINVFKRGPTILSVKGLFATDGINETTMCIECHYAGCLYTELRYAQGRGAF